MRYCDMHYVIGLTKDSMHIMEGGVVLVEDEAGF